MSKEEVRSPQLGKLPSSFEAWKSKARDSLSEEQFSFLLAGAGFDLATRANDEAFYRWRLVPRILRDVSDRDLSAHLFGLSCPAPIALAPVGSQKSIHPEGELATARAAAVTSIPFVMSTASSSSIEEVANVMDNSPKLFQIYPAHDSEIVDSFIRRAENASFSGLVLTVDRASEYPRYLLDERYQPLGNAVYFSDPVFNSKCEKLGMTSISSRQKFQRIVSRNSSFSWKDLSNLRQKTRLPIFLKGLLHPEDAKLAVENEVDGIVVSNHGGRRMDGEVATIDILPEIVSVVNRRVPVLLDSGIKSGVDVIKALALGASGVLIGHLFAYALAVAGETGVRKVIADLVGEIDSALAICGCKSLKDLDPSLVRKF